MLRHTMPATYPRARMPRINTVHHGQTLAQCRINGDAAAPPLLFHCSHRLYLPSPLCSLLCALLIFPAALLFSPTSRLAAALHATERARCDTLVQWPPPPPFSTRHAPPSAAMRHARERQSQRAHCRRPRHATPWREPALDATRQAIAVHHAVQRCTTTSTEPASPWSPVPTAVLATLTTRTASSPRHAPHYHDDAVLRPDLLPTFPGRLAAQHSTPSSPTITDG